MKYLKYEHKSIFPFWGRVKLNIRDRYGKPNIYSKNPSHWLWHNSTDTHPWIHATECKLCKLGYGDMPCDAPITSDIPHHDEEHNLSLLNTSKHWSTLFSFENIGHKYDFEGAGGPCSHHPSLFAWKSAPNSNFEIAISPLILAIGTFFSPICVYLCIFSDFLMTLSTQTQVAWFAIFQISNMAPAMMHVMLVMKGGVWCDGVSQGVSPLPNLHNLCSNMAPAMTWCLDWFFACKSAPPIEILKWLYLH